MGKDIQWLLLWHKMFTPMTTIVARWSLLRGVTIACLSVKLSEKLQN